MITPEQCRAARGWLDWSQDDLATRANVSLSTVRDFEKGRRMPIANNITAMEGALRGAGCHFTSVDGEASGIAYQHRIREKDTYLPMLELLDDAPDGFMTTADLIKNLEIYMRVSGEDAEILDSRSDSRFSQIVRNIVSHKSTVTNPIGAGWVTYDAKRHGMTITREGRDHLVSEQGRRQS
jgi:transcriptional regulator with XRE-family HTH domain